MVEAAEDSRRGSKEKGSKGKWGSALKRKAELGLGLGLGSGSGYSSTKPWRQNGQKGSDSSETVILLVHMWQKYGLASPAAASPDDMVSHLQS